MRKKSSGKQIPGQLGVAAATIAMVAMVVGLAQIPGAWTTAGDPVALIPPPVQASIGPSAAMPGAPAPSSDPPSRDPVSNGPAPDSSASSGPTPGTAGPAGTPAGPAATPAAGQLPGQPPSSAAGPSAAAPAAGPPSTATAPPSSEPAGAVPDARAVQRVTDSCSRRLQSDASNSGIVTGTVVPRPYSLVSVEYVGIPHRSTAGPGLESYDVELAVTTQPLDGPAQTDRRVCRVYDYDSHVDWLAAG